MGVLRLVGRRAGYGYWLWRRTRNATP